MVETGELKDLRTVTPKYTCSEYTKKWALNNITCATQSLNPFSYGSLWTAYIEHMSLLTVDQKATHVGLA